MKTISRHPLPFLLLILILILLTAPFNASAQAPVSTKLETESIHTYRVDNVVTKEDRTAVARTGADIIEIGADYVIVRAAAQEASQMLIITSQRWWRTSNR
jgi:carboxypeptidase T